jgi:hypothetical protein
MSHAECGLPDSGKKIGTNFLVFFLNRFIIHHLLLARSRPDPSPPKFAGQIRADGAAIPSETPEIQPRNPNAGRLVAGIRTPPRV